MFAITEDRKIQAEIATELFKNYACLAKRRSVVALMQWQEINFTRKIDFFLFLMRFLPTRQRLAYYILRFIESVIAVKEANLEFFCSHRQGCLDRRWRKERRRHSGDAIIRNIRMFFPKSSERMTIIRRAENLKKKKACAISLNAHASIV